MNNNYCYILFSESLNRYYIGSTKLTVNERLERHLSKHYGDNKFTAKSSDWVIFMEIGCATFEQAQKIERHIKRMKSKKYINNLKSYPEIKEALLDKYK